MILSNINKSVMKNLLVSLLLLVSISSIGQNKRSALADPKLGQITITNLTGSNLDADALEQNQMIRLRQRCQPMQVIPGDFAIDVMNRTMIDGACYSAGVVRSLSLSRAMQEEFA